MSEILFQPLGNPVAARAGLERIADIDPRLTRTNYFDGRLLTAEDLTRDQIYLDQRLREVGRALGSGIMSGLELGFDPFSGLLTLSAGQALSAAGRILELSTPLVVDLGDRALIAQLNDNQHRRFNRALYAVVLRYVDVGTDIAEVFPTDLGAQRGFQYALITEAVQLGLVPLPTPLAQQGSLQIRARLMREYLGAGPARGAIPEDAVALGVLAIQDDTPQWLDRELLRHPVRAETAPGDLQADLSRQYEALLADILTARRSGGLTGDFSAGDYLSLLPPVGTVPKEAIDPVNGRQGFFPENFHVSIAPVRRSELDLIKAESMGLPPIDLSSGEPVDVVVLAPLANLDYGHFAGALERPADAEQRRLPQIDLLQLKLYPTQPVHALNTDANAWQAIWDRLGDTAPVFLRRPTRAAETAISCIVLAIGSSVPEPTLEEPSPADSGGLFENEGAVLLRSVNIRQLAELRPPNAAAGRNAVDALAAGFGEDPEVIRQCLQILLRVERRYDPVIWQTLRLLASRSRLDAFADGLRALPAASPTGPAVAELGGTLGFTAALLNQWAALDTPGP